MESRKLPLAIGCFSIVFIAIVDVSDIRLWYKIAISSIFGLGAFWALWRAANPRWVVKIDDCSLQHRDLSTKQVTNISLSKIIDAAIEKSYVMRVGAEGGIGLQKELLLKTQNNTLSLRLPLMEVNPNKIVEAIHAHLSH